MSHFRLIVPKLVKKLVFINLLNYDSHTPTTDFVNTFFSNNFLPCITHPTRVSRVSSTVIDNIFTNEIGTNYMLKNFNTYIGSFPITSNSFSG